MNVCSKGESQSFSVKDLLGTLLLRGIDIKGGGLGINLSEKLNDYQTLLVDTPKEWGNALGCWLLKDDEWDFAG